MLANHTPITAAEARVLFAPFARSPTLVLAVSGGPDSVALLHLIAQWRAASDTGPVLHVATVDHGLRAESADEVALVARHAAARGLLHETLAWDGEKPTTGLPAAARTARYRLLREAAKRVGASHILTGHTRDDQAETVLMRLLRGSGVAGLAGMARDRDLVGVILSRPFLDIAKTRLVATLDDAGVAYATDPTNVDPKYLRSRLRSLMPLLSEEGLTADGLSRFAKRMARADVALDAATDDAERRLAHADGWDEAAFKALPSEIRIRVLARALATFGETPELGQIETLVDDLMQPYDTFARTLAGALIRVRLGRLTITRAPPRR